MRIAIVSDTHGLLDERIARLLGGVDLALHAGDVGDAGVLDLLAERCAQVVAVRGNNDVPEKWPTVQHSRLSGLPEQVCVQVPGGTIALVHGHRAGPPRRRHERLRKQFPHARLVVYGHSHRACMDRSARPWVLNPGVAGRARTYGGPSLVLLSAEASGWRLRTRRFEPAGPPGTGRS